ncbi:MAG: hypothetical protein JNK72_24585 [Myxococcales bacterium]|nr:hypothetical protein [Myxococcales bacterium]
MKRPRAHAALAQRDLPPSFPDTLKELPEELQDRGVWLRVRRTSRGPRGGIVVHSTWEPFVVIAAATPSKDRPREGQLWLVRRGAQYIVLGKILRRMARLSDEVAERYRENPPRAREPGEVYPAPGDPLIGRRLGYEGDKHQPPFDGIVLGRAKPCDGSAPHAYAVGGIILRRNLVTAAIRRQSNPDWGRPSAPKPAQGAAPTSPARPVPSAAPPRSPAALPPGAKRAADNDIEVVEAEVIARAPDPATVVGMEVVRVVRLPAPSRPGLPPSARPALPSPERAPLGLPPGAVPIGTVRGLPAPSSVASRGLPAHASPSTTPRALPAPSPRLLPPPSALPVRGNDAPRGLPAPPRAMIPAPSSLPARPSRTFLGVDVGAIRSPGDLLALVPEAEAAMRAFGPGQEREADKLDTAYYEAGGALRTLARQRRDADAEALADRLTAAGVRLRQLRLRRRSDLQEATGATEDFPPEGAIGQYVRLDTGALVTIPEGGEVRVLTSQPPLLTSPEMLSTVWAGTESVHPGSVQVVPWRAVMAMVLYADVSSGVFRDAIRGVWVDLDGKGVGFTRILPVEDFERWYEGGSEHHQLRALLLQQLGKALHDEVPLHQRLTALRERSERSKGGASLEKIEAQIGALLPRLTAAQRRRGYLLDTIRHSDPRMARGNVTQLQLLAGLPQRALVRYPVDG